MKKTRLRREIRKKTVSRRNTMVRISRGFSETIAQMAGISRVPIKLALTVMELREYSPHDGTNTDIDVHITVNNRDAANHDLSSSRSECKESSTGHILL